MPTQRSAGTNHLVIAQEAVLSACRLVGLSAMRSGTNPQMMVAAARQSMDRSATFSRGCQHWCWETMNANNEQKKLFFFLLVLAS